MPEISPSKATAPGISGRKVRERPCIMCGGKRDVVVAYSTRQGKRSKRLQPRCRECEKINRKALHDKDREGGRRVSREWRAANPEYTPAYNRRRQQDPEVRALKAFHQRLRKARLRTGEYESDAVRALYRQAKEIEKIVASCPVFAIPELGFKMHVDHIKPISKGGKHIIENLQILPIGLNMRKGVKYYA